jgi:hypothetical protein
LEELTRNYGATVVLSTATQPDVRPLFSKPVEIREMVANVPFRFEQFRRVRLERMGKTDYAQLLQRMINDRQALCIVNTRKAARELFELARETLDPSAVFHLSARMCPVHRKSKLDEIRKRLDDHLPCVLISTQLIECGVDVDFPVVYRELAGLDSIAQAAGRCNRHGERPMGTVYVFDLEGAHRKGWFGLTAGAAQTVLEQYPEDPLSLEAMQAYFRELYYYQTLGGKEGTRDLTDKHGILRLLNERAREFAFPFETVAQLFEWIQTAAKPVIIGYDEEARKHLEALRHATSITGIMRKLQPYVVQLYPQEFAAFRQAGEMEEVREGVFRLTNPDRWYRDDIGVRPFNEQLHADEVYVY